MTLSLFRGHVPFWTQAWLINALLDPGVVLTDEVQAWLESLLGSRAPAVLRMRAAIALASHQELGATTVAEMLDKLPVAARPDAVAAMAIAGGVSHRHTAFPDDRLLQRVYELVSEHREDPAPFV